VKLMMMVVFIKILEIFHHLVSIIN
jgi:hypothetical protein